MDNLTAVLNSINDIRLEKRPVPEPQHNEVLLRMGCVGICGSDVHYWTKGRIGNFVLEKPMVIGHEASGTVIKTGASVTHLKPGDRVAIEPGVPCRTCDSCKEGKYNLCPGMVFCATPPHDGNLAHFYKHPADFCYKLPDNVSLEEGALLEPLSVGVHACRKAGVTLGSVVLILGAGPIGLVTLLTARAMSASKIIILDVLEHRLETAKKCGADFTMNSGKEGPQDLAKRIHELLGVLPDKTIDCVGLESTTILGIEATRPGGRYVLVGMGSQEMKVPLVNASIKEVDIVGSFRYCNDYKLALEMVASGKADVKQLITHHFNIEETEKAFKTARDNTGNPIKILIHCQ